MCAPPRTRSVIMRGTGGDGRGRDGADGTGRNARKRRLVSRAHKRRIQLMLRLAFPRRRVVVADYSLAASRLVSALGPHFVSLSQTHAHTRSSLILGSSHLIIYLQYCTVDEVKPSRFAEASSVAFAFARSVPFRSVPQRLGALRCVALRCALQTR